MKNNKLNNIVELVETLRVSFKKYNAEIKRVGNSGLEWKITVEMPNLVYNDEIRRTFGLNEYEYFKEFKKQKEFIEIKEIIKDKRHIIKIDDNAMNRLQDLIEVLNNEFKTFDIYSNGEIEDIRGYKYFYVNIKVKSQYEDEYLNNNFEDIENDIRLTPKIIKKEVTEIVKPIYKRGEEEFFRNQCEIMGLSQNHADERIEINNEKWRLWDKYLAEIENQ